MSWVPKYIINGGMYGGRVIPEGDLTGFIARFPNKVPVTNGFYVRDAYNSAAWQGAFGVDSDLILEYALSNKDGTPYTFDLMEFTAPNPEGAQYYKQSLIIEAVTECSVEQRNEVTISGVQYWATYVSIWFRINRIRRREYPTPYSTPTSTTLADFSGQPYVYFTYLTGGSEIALAAGYKNQLYNRVTITFGFGDYNDKTYLGVGYYSRALNLTIPPTDNQRVYMGCLGAIEKAVIDDAFDVDFKPEEKDDPNEEDDPEEGPGQGGGGGGEGPHDLPNEEVPIPPLPTIGPASVSWLTVYMMSAQDLDDFGQELVDPDAMQKLKQYFNDPLDAIVGIILVPAVAGPRYPKTPVIHGTPDYQWSRTFMAILNQYTRLDCGSIHIDPYWDSAFDFDPYSRYMIFLPFIGYKPLKADEIVGKTIGVEYHIDVCTGDCTAFITRSSTADDIYGGVPTQVIAQFNGNCGIRVPIGRISHDAAIDASMRLLSAGLGIAGGAAMAGLGLVDAGEISMSQASNQISGAAMSAINAQKRTIERSGALGGNAGYMGVLKPHIIRQIPRQFLPDNYKELNGYPANKGGTLSHYIGTGYQAIETIKLDNIGAFDSEVSEIISLLKGGVLV